MEDDVSLLLVSVMRDQLQTGVIFTLKNTKK
jgi:hypothetical protein